MSVAHYDEQNGDAMRDPEIVFEVVAGGWHPVSIQQDHVGSYREAVFVGEDGKAYVRHALVRDIAAFTRVWDRNLRDQGFVDTASAGPRRRAAPETPANGSPDSRHHTGSVEERSRGSWLTTRPGRIPCAAEGEVPMGDRLMPMR